jgi:hypothetical protein
MVIAVDNVITNNQFHGVAIGPRGSAILEGNLIENNYQEDLTIIPHNQLSSILFPFRSYTPPSRDIPLKPLWLIILCLMTAFDASFGM